MDRIGGMKKKRKLNKKGSYIIEAAVVLPVIIMVVITAVLIIMFFYGQMVEQCKLHMTIRKQAGMMSGNTLYLNDEVNSNLHEAEIYTEETPLGGSVYGRKNLIMKHKGALYKKGTFVVEGSCYEIDGPSYIRYSSAIKE
jgi:hypothetical protein